MSMSIVTFRVEHKKVHFIVILKKNEKKKKKTIKNHVLKKLSDVCQCNRLRLTLHLHCKSTSETELYETSHSYSHKIQSILHTHTI